MDVKEHWETLYSTKGEHDVSWFEQLPTVSIRTIESAELMESVPSLHRTPWGSTQSFQYSRLRRVH
jgi:hypothetical protein